MKFIRLARSRARTMPCRAASLHSSDAASFCTTASVLASVETAALHARKVGSAGCNRSKKFSIWDLTNCTMYARDAARRKSSFGRAPGGCSSGLLKVAIACG
ncbi:hypothetical protein PHYSODRAFT_354657 [Phytophthora sojae]|uniref:Uncharacterized protein n=1 Tax=Phytophthora sojae (strain P6497) TaxID=1094619 RepID=G4ZJM5_PHYSP|nr:hypothetical protein PHYSODRAFT_354657 [Phytophthora sojae]EGZ18245.1 hypothetical protein PHYSODRAFT_354657 [Phytophthora sojae]|eukprot:XP_009527303.1 hypothetical protein PHYSODRAFT_354657 [Phytophthora sojae]